MNIVYVDFEDVAKIALGFGIFGAKKLNPEKTRKVDLAAAVLCNFLRKNLRKKTSLLYPMLIKLQTTSKLKVNQEMEIT